MGKPISKEMILSGRRFSIRELEEIQDTVSILPNLSRNELAITICEHFSWVRPCYTNSAGRAMNDLLELLTGEDLRSDGRADEVADEVIRKPDLFDQLVEGLSESDDIIRARTAHALEKVSRTHTEICTEVLPQLLEIAHKDKVPMVKWHLAMIFGNLAVMKDKVDVLTTALFQLLENKSVFVRSWAIVSLTTIGRIHSGKRRRIIGKIQLHQKDKSIAIRSKVAKAMTVLNKEDEPMPAGWLKSKRLLNIT